MTGLNSIVNDKFDILCIAESKLDSSFPKAQFVRKGYKTPYRLDISSRSGGLVVYVRDGISSRYLKDFRLPTDIQFIPIELRLKSHKWLIIFIYRHKDQKLEFFLQHMSNLLNFYSNFERCILMGDFNCEPSNPHLDNFLKENSLYCHTKTKTCFKSDEGSCIDLILSNQKYGLQKTGSWDTGLSDFHHLIYTQLKSRYTRLQPRKVNYRCYNNFIEENFLTDLSLKITSSNINEIESFENKFETVLNRHAPRKSRIIRGNEKPHVNKDLRKAIMDRSRLRNIYQRSQRYSDRCAYRKQRNFVCSMNRKIKKIYFDTVASNSDNSSHNFWEICKPFFSDKSIVSEKIILVNEDGIVNSDSTTAKLFNKYFNGITKTLDIHEWPQNSGQKTGNPVHDAISRYADHPSIIKIKYMFVGNSFEFTNTDTETVHKLVMSLNNKKSTSGEISSKILQKSADICSFALKNCFNHCLDRALFPESLKCATITPVFKEGDPTCVKNYRPISILPTVSKVFDCFSTLLCGFRKGHSTQHAILRLLHLWQRALDDSNIVGTVLMDLSKAYDCLPPDLLIAKLAAYGVKHNSLSFLYDYLTKRQHRVKIGNSLSSFLYISMGVPQGSILGPILFNIFLNDLLLSHRETELCNFADDNTLFAIAKTLAEVVVKLNIEIQDILHWFQINSLVANPGKFQVMFLGRFDPISTFDIGNISVKVKNQVKLLGIFIDDKLRFNSHVELKCQRAANKISALRRIRSFISLKTAKALCNAYIFSNFNYCPLIWMNFVKGNNNKIEKIQRRALSVVYQDVNSDLLELLAIEKGVTFHIKFIFKLLEEIFKTLHKQNPSFLQEIFTVKKSGYELRRGEQLALPSTKTVKFGLQSLSFVGSLLWDRLPKDVKSSATFNIFKGKLKMLPNNFCTCPICKLW